MRRAVASSAASLARKRAITPSCNAGADVSSVSTAVAASAARYSSAGISNNSNATGSCGAPMQLMSQYQQQHVRNARIHSRPNALELSGRRYFSAATKENDEDEKDDSSDNDGRTTKNETTTKKTKKSGSGDSLRNAVNRAKAKDGEEIPDDSAGDDDKTTELLHRARDTAASFWGGVSATWSELLDSGRPRSINKRIHDPVRDLADGEIPEDDDAAADKYEGSSAIMITGEDEHLTAWERMQRRLSDTPIIQGELVYLLSNEILVGCACLARSKSYDKVVYMLYQ